MQHQVTMFLQPENDSTIFALTKEDIMHKHILLIVTAILLALPSAGFAKDYTKVVTVGSPGGNFTSPIKALASITDASAKKTVLVKVMPGTYDLGTESLQMKEYVDLEGAGSDKTMITSSNFNTDIDNCAVGTVIMAQNSSLRNVKIVNSAQDTSNEAFIVGIVFDNVTADTEGIRVQVGADGVYNSPKYGICSSGSAGHATLKNVDIEVRNGNQGQSGAIALNRDGNITLLNSKLAAFTQEGNTHVIDCINGQSMVGVLKVDNSQITGVIKGSRGGNRGIDVRDCKAVIANTVVNLSGGNDNIGVIASHQDVSIDSSKIYSPGKALVNDGESTFKISNSLLQGSIPNLPNLILLHNYTDKDIPIPDR